MSIKLILHITETSKLLKCWEWKQFVSLRLARGPMVLMHIKDVPIGGTLAAVQELEKIVGIDLITPETTPKL